ncbi:MAG: nucleotidyltransferase family protein [Alphaproteobacteria bacterium]|nr:nucleotidyltransferase family protein [Alphaproteobacteria bacterium]
MTNDVSLPFLSETAMILAAGFGMRMRPLTLDKPKPLLVVAGHTMLDRALDHLVRVGVKRVVVNTHYLGDCLREHLSRRKDVEIILSPEDAVLDTGGGTQKARPHFGDKPFILLGGDMPILDGCEPALARLARMWEPERMDQLLLLSPREKARGFGPNGDFMLRGDGSLWRKGAPIPREYVFISAQIVKPQLYDEIDEVVFSNNKIFDLCEARGRLFGLVHDGSCFHVGTPEDLAEANALFDSGKGWG